MSIVNAPELAIDLVLDRTGYSIEELNEVERRYLVRVLTHVLGRSDAASVLATLGNMNFQQPTDGEPEIWSRGGSLDLARMLMALHLTIKDRLSQPRAHLLKRIYIFVGMAIHQQIVA